MFKCAFDVVPRERLLLKMRYYGIHKLNPWLRNFLTNRKQTVLIDGVKSRFIEVISGVCQGTVISALCFLIFINYLPNTIKESFTGIFCDNTMIAKEIKCQKDTDDLQADIQNVEDWANKWGMSFNTLKCTKMTVTNKRKPIERNYIINDKIIKNSN